MICRNAGVCAAFNEVHCSSPKHISVCMANNDFDMKARKVKAFNWLAYNTDQISIEYTGTHYQVYEGFGEDMAKKGVAHRSLVQAIESLYT